jgi:hypothetical protein
MTLKTEEGSAVEDMRALVVDDEAGLRGFVAEVLRGEVRLRQLYAK